MRDARYKALAERFLSLKNQSFIGGTFLGRISAHTNIAILPGQDLGRHWLSLLHLAIQLYFGVQVCRCSVFRLLRICLGDFHSLTDMELRSI